MEINSYFKGSRSSIMRIYFLAPKKPVISNVVIVGDKTGFIACGEKEILEDYIEHASDITVIHLEYLMNNSCIPLLKHRGLGCRIEPNATIRENVDLANNCIILSGAVINIGAKIGDNTMIDMNAVIGSKAIIGNNCHIGAGAVIAGVLEPVSKDPVIIKDGCMIGANAVILEGVTIGEHAVIGAGSIVTQSIPPYTVAYGNPARIIKQVDKAVEEKTKKNKDLRKG